MVQYLGFVGGFFDEFMHFFPAIHLVWVIALEKMINSFFGLLA